jgi:hypothetical protein
MKTTTQRITTLARLGTGLARFGRRVADVIAECNYAQRRLTMLMISTDAYLIDRDKAPGDYAEFLARTSGALLREPAAGRRADGQLIG